jgi:uncharacterized protein
MPFPIGDAMALPPHLARLLDASAYPHDCGTIELVETHISWVLLTGTYAYKIKKPVRLPFVDFGTLERRAHFCREEIRCNRQLAPSLYLDVVPILDDSPGVRIGLAGQDETQAIEWAVRMRQFPAAAQLDRMLEAARLELPMLRDFGNTLARLHANAPRCPDGANAVEHRIVQPMRDNFEALDALDLDRALHDRVNRVRAATDVRITRHRRRLRARMIRGYVRECHGDLHLANLVWLDDAVIPFDCLEFDPELRTIDTMSDVAFLFMDCAERGRPDLAYAFLDGYLDASGDYGGAALIPLYAAYRAMVRAKVRGIRHAQAAREHGANVPVKTTAAAQRDAYLAWADRLLARPPGGMVMTCGVSGSGKSYLAERLVSRVGAIRLRSDVARQALRGHAPQPSAHAAVGQGLYTRGRVNAVYLRLARLAARLIAEGETVIVDATFLTRDLRARFVELARRAGSPVVILHCSAPESVLRERVSTRQRTGYDPSEAGIAVLERQLADQELPGAREPVLHVDTEPPLDAGRLDDIAQAVRQSLAADRRT